MKHGQKNIKIFVKLVISYTTLEKCKHLFFCFEDFMKMEQSSALVVRLLLVALTASGLATAVPMNICKYQKSQSYKSPFVIVPQRTEFISLPPSVWYIFRSVLRPCETRLLGLSRLSVCPNGTTRLPQNGFSWNFVFLVFFVKTCRENSSLINI